jgi:hypothetical protein
MPCASFSMLDGPGGNIHFTMQELVQQVLE